MTREEAIEIIRDTPIDLRSTREDDIHTLYATAQMMAIEALQERPKGRWIQEIHTGLIGDTNEYNDTYFFRCSICGRTVFEKEPYCHCGADMREIENE